MSAIPTDGTRASELRQLLDPIVRSKPLRAYLHYQAGDEEAALRSWNKTAEADDERGLLALRSLAVHHHRRAFALEVEGQSEAALPHWTKAVPLWARALQAKTFRSLLPQWSAVTSVSALQPGELDAMVELLCECLLSPHITLAEQAADARRWKIAAAHIAILRESGVPAPIVAAALERLTDRICHLTHEPILHTTFETTTAEAHETVAAFVRKHVPERVDGNLELAAILVWRALKAAESRDHLESVWKRLREPATRELLGELASARDAERDAVMAHLIRTRLRELADAACALEITRLNMLFGKREDLVDRTNAALDRATTSYDRRKALDLSILEVERLATESEAGLSFCEELGTRFGEGPDLARVREIVEGRRRRLDEDLATLRDMRKER